MNSVLARCAGSVLLLLLLLGGSTVAAEDGFRPLLPEPSKSLAENGWDGDPKLWSLEGGVIRGRTTPENPTRGNTFLIWRAGVVDDFELRLSYRIVGGNSGIQYRSRELEQWVVGGYQADIDSGDTFSGILYEERLRGILAKRGEKVEIGGAGARQVTGSTGDSAEIQAAIKKEEWNDYVITARGATLTHTINGRVTQVTVDREEGKAAASGILALQLHAGPPMTVEFKDVRLKRLPLEGKKKIVLVAGTQSHGPGDHEFNAGCLLLASCLEKLPGVLPVVYRSGWPRDTTAFDNADAIVLYMDGGGGHPVARHLDEVDAIMKKGVGLACLHYGVEVETGKPGDRFLDWIGGYFEVDLSVNPHWTIKSPTLAVGHPITRGVKPFEINDEWYFFMRFREGMRGVTPILSAVAPPETMSRPDGPHEGNPKVRASVARGDAQVLAWAAERPDGGRGFGFTGGHRHTNWGNDDFRRLVLNALLWVAKVDVPPGGAPSSVSAEALDENLDPKGGQRPRARPRTSSVDPPRGRPAWRSDVVAKGLVEGKVDLLGARQLWLVVDDGGDGFGCDWADWVEPRLEGSRGTLRLTELRWKSASADWGEVRVGKNAGGGPLRVGGEAIADGIGVHANSVVEFELPEGYERFVTKAGLDNGGTDQGCGSTVRFAVYTERPPEEARRPRPRGGSGPLAPEDAIQELDIHPGLEIGLFAAEPMVANPTNMDIDARGRVWVTEGVNYRRWSNNKAEGDRIVILEDSDLDGKADRSKVFYQDPSINAALGICVLDRRVIVSCSPNVFIFTDRDGDDVPDEKKVLFSGISGVQHDHGAHAFVFGPDGKLYFNLGNEGRQLRDPDGKPLVDSAGNEVSANGRPYRQGMVFRMDLDTGAVETLAHNFRNNYEVCVDSFGTIWQSDNDDDGNRGVRINCVIEYGNYGYTDEMTGQGWSQPRTNWEEEIPLRHWHLNDPGVVPNYLQTGGGSPTGICVYEGTLLPADLRGQVIHCDAGPNVVRAYPARRRGAGFEASVIDVVKGRDSWFRPSDVCVAPDGALFVSDWYDAGVGGHNMADNDPATARGRIYRLAPPGSRPQLPPLDLETGAGAAGALASPNLARRALGWRALRAMGERAAPELLTLWSDGSTRLRARALHLLARIPGREDAAIAAGLRDQQPELRMTALRVARSLGRDVLGAVKALAHDLSPHVRRECAVALRNETGPEAADLWAELALQHEAQDRWSLEALGIGASRNEDDFLNAWLQKVGEEWRAPAGRDIVWRSRGTRVPQLLAEVIEDPGTSRPEKMRCLRAFDFLRSDSKEPALALLLASRDGDVAREALARLKSFDPEKNPGHAAILASLLEANRGTTQFVNLVERFRPEGQTDGLWDALWQHAGDSTGALAARLLLDRGEGSRLATLVSASGDPGKALKAVTAVGNAADPRGLALLAPLASSADVEPEVSAAAVRGLCATRQGAAKLLELARAGKVPPEAGTAAAITLSRTPWEDVRAEASKLFPLPATKDEKPLPPIVELVSLRGDAAQGRRVFEAQCAQCHAAAGIGKDFGPALSEIGDKLGRDALYTSILDPNAGISFNFEGETLSLDSGADVVGIVVSETSDSVTLKMQDAIVTTYPKSSVVERSRLKTSIMPTGLERNITQSELVSLVEFLSGLKKPTEG